MSKPIGQTEADSALASDAEAYVLGCLGDDARNAFETRLATDQLAREALAGAVELVGAAQTALHDSSEYIVPSQQSRLSNLSSQALCGFAGLLVLAVFVGLRLNWPVENSTQPVSSDRLAVIWSDVISETEDSLDPLSTIIDDSQDVGEDNEYLVADSPDWMLAAVGQLSQQDDMHHERDMENR